VARYPISDQLPPTDALAAAAELESRGFHREAAELRSLVGSLGGLAIGGFGAGGIPSAGFGPGTPLFAPAPRGTLARTNPTRRDLGDVPAVERVRRDTEAFGMSILGDVLRAPASQPGTSTSLIGDIFQSGAQALLGYAGARSQGRVLREQRKLLKRMQGPTRIGGGGMSILDGNINAAMVPYQAPSAAPYVTSQGGGGLYTQASFLPAVLEGGEMLAGTAVGTVAASAARRLGSYLLSLLPTLGAAGAIDLAVNLIGSGMAGGEAGPYANPKHNKITGVLRGDVIALRRVKRSAKRLRKVLTLAGVGGRRGAARFRRRRAC
jgi:hypothetical protein